MVPRSGLTSNSASQLLAEWNEVQKGKLEASELVFNPEIEQLFDTLAEWNDYLENYVPGFQKPQEPGQ